MANTKSYLNNYKIFYIFKMILEASGKQMVLIVCCWGDKYFELFIKILYWKTHLQRYRYKVKMWNEMFNLL